MKVQNTKDNVKLNIGMVLPYIGEFGRFQKILCMIGFVVCLPTSFQVLIMYFSTITPPWKCIVNSTVCNLNGTMLADDNRRCLMPRSQWYYTESKKFSLVTQFDIHCNNAWLLNLLSSILFLGWAFGGVILGWGGDQYGRKAILTPCLSLFLIVGFISSFISNIYLIIVCRFVIGFFIPGVQLQVFIILSELVGNKHRPIALFLFTIYNPVGWCILAFKAYIIKDWKILSMVCTAPYIFTIVFCKFIPESIRWMHLHGKIDKVLKLMHRIAKWNKTHIAINVEISASDEVLVIRANPIDLFRTRIVALKSFRQAFVWYATVTCYYGIHMAANDLGGSVYRDFALLNLCETPAIPLAAVLCIRYGRKRTSLIPLFIGGSSCLVIAFLPTEGGIKIMRVVLGIFGNSTLSIAFFGIYQWSVEIYPLNIRNQGMGFLQVVSHGGSAIVPWIVKGLKPFGSWCPFVVLGGFALIASILGKWLPETKEAALVLPRSDIIRESDVMDTKDQSVIPNENCG